MAAEHSVGYLPMTVRSGVLLAILVLPGCKSTTVIDAHRAAPTRIEAEDAIVVLGRRHSNAYETEKDFVSCVGKSLSSGSNSVAVIPEKTFVDSMYPFFETSTAPTDVRNLEQMVQIPEVADRFRDFNVRYFVWIDGHTETTDRKGSMSCSIGPGGGGCFGFVTWDDSANYEASIWDFRELSLSGKISAETQGTSYLPAIIIPVPLLARVQANACKTMAEQIKTFLN